MATYGDFPGVRVESSQGGVRSVSIGREEKLLIFGEANYQSDGSVDGEGTVNEPTQINAPLEADRFFGEGSELADAMQEANLNGANLNYLYGVAVPRESVSAESQSTQSGSLENYAIVENTDEITVEDVDGTDSTVRSMEVEFRYSPDLSTPSETDVLFLNPLTGDYAADSGASDHFEFTYKYSDYGTAVNAQSVQDTINENETGVMWALSDSDAVSADLATVVEGMRENYKLVTGFAFAEPNDSFEFVEDEISPENGGAAPRYDTAVYDQANQSISDAAFYKPAPARVDDDPHKTIGGGLAGLYAGNPIDDAIYNEIVEGYNALDQQLNKTEADELRDQNIIPVRSGGSVRVKGNRATSFGESDAVAADFFTRRIMDRVILMVRQVGQSILSEINNPETRNRAERRINEELGKLAADGLIQPNGEELKYSVQVYEDSTNREEVNIDVQFTPYGIVKNVDASISINV